MTAALTRRAALGGLAAAALAPAPLAAQVASPGWEAFAARCRSLSGFVVLPIPLVSAVRDALGEDAEDAVLLKALYTGVVPAGGEEKERVAYPLALQWAAVEDWVNVPSFCGGVPGFWAYPPEGA